MMIAVTHAQEGSLSPTVRISKMNSAFLTIGATLLWLLVDSDLGHATQAQNGQNHYNVVAAEITPTTCAVTGKGRTRAHCENHSLLGSGPIAAEKSQYLSTVIVATVIVMLIVLTVLASLSLALTLLAAWARRTPRLPVVERAEVKPSALSVPGEDRRVPLPTHHPSVQRSWRKTASSSAAFRLVWLIWLIWFF